MAIQKLRIWLATGANVVGGCCGTRPAHIAAIHELIGERTSDDQDQALTAGCSGDAA